MIVQTSLTAFKKVRPNITKRQQEVLDTLEGLGGKASMHAVAMQMLRPLHTISGRFSELVRKEKIRIAEYECVGGSWRAVYVLNVPRDELSNSIPWRLCRPRDGERIDGVAHDHINGDVHHTPSVFGKPGGGNICPLSSHPLPQARNQGGPE